MSGNVEHPPNSQRLQGQRGQVSAAALARVLSAAMMLLAACDAVLNSRDRLGVQHAIVDECVFLFGLAGIVITSLRLRRAVQGQQRAYLEATRLSQVLGETRNSLQAKADTLTHCLEQARQEASHWKQQSDLLAAGLGAAIDAQFRRWALTPAEREIGHLLLKGLSHKEIARIREVSEATVRQQAQSLYRKAEVAGRNDLAAFFIEDLLQPRANLSTDHF